MRPSKLPWHIHSAERSFQRDIKYGWLRNWRAKGAILRGNDVVVCAVWWCQDAGFSRRKQSAVAMKLEHAPTITGQSAVAMKLEHAPTITGHKTHAPEQTENRKLVSWIPNGPF
jgi:hypothetical protein